MSINRRITVFLMKSFQIGINMILSDIFNRLNLIGLINKIKKMADISLIGSYSMLAIIFFNNHIFMIFSQGILAFQNTSPFIL